MRAAPGIKLGRTDTTYDLSLVAEKMRRKEFFWERGRRNLYVFEGEGGGDGVSQMFVLFVRFGMFVEEREGVYREGGVSHGAVLCCLAMTRRYPNIVPKSTLIKLEPSQYDFYF